MLSTDNRSCNKGRGEWFILTANHGHVDLDTGPDEDIGNVSDQFCRVSVCFDTVK